jgi:hypothetical protein
MENILESLCFGYFVIGFIIYILSLIGEYSKYGTVKVFNLFIFVVCMLAWPIVIWITFFKKGK